MIILIVIIIKLDRQRIVSFEHGSILVKVIMTFLVIILFGGFREMGLALVVVEAPQRMWRRHECERQLAGRCMSPPGSSETTTQQK